MKACLLKRFLVVALVMLLDGILATHVFADGIPVTSDLKHVRGDRTVFVLDEDQIKDVEQKREVVLTDEQIKPLKAIYEKTPSKLEVLTSRWDDCTCGMDIYGIWCRVGELDVPHYELQLKKSSDEYYTKNPPPKISQSDSNPEGESEQAGENWDDHIFIRRYIILDSRGDMYLDGKKVSEEQLRAEIDEMSSTEAPSGKKVSRSTWFDTPPPISEDIDKKIHDLINRTKAYCKEKDVNCYAIGFRGD